MARILIVEDEPLIRMVSAEILREAGFVVDEAASAAEAMDIFNSQAEPLDAAIIDIGLPDRQGDVLTAELRVLWPAIPIIIATGHDSSALRERFGADSLVRIVGKPYSDDALTMALESLGVPPPALAADA